MDLINRQLPTTVFVFVFVFGFVFGTAVGTPLPQPVMKNETIQARTMSFKIALQPYVHLFIAHYLV